MADKHDNKSDERNESQTSSQSFSLQKDINYLVSNESGETYEFIDTQQNNTIVLDANQILNDVEMDHVIINHSYTYVPNQQDQILQILPDPSIQALIDLVNSQSTQINVLNQKMNAQTEVLREILAHTENVDRLTAFEDATDSI